MRLDDTPQMTGPADVRSKTEGVWLPVALLAAAWVAAHPYFGLIHDARFYLLDAMEALQPGRFRQDLFFKYGSQNSFTIFTWLYKPLVGAAGPLNAYVIASVAGQALWFAGLIALMRAMFAERREWIAGSAAGIVFCATYGGLGDFRYGEQFANPRLFAEALVMGAMALAITRRPVFAVATLIFAGAIHPLVAETGVTILAVVAALQERRFWLVFLLGAGVILALALAGVQPFARLWLRFDDTWFAIVRKRNGVDILSRWSFGDFLRVASVIVTLGAATLFADTTQRRWLIATALAAVGGLAATFVGGDILRNVLIVNAQTWRALWFATLLANTWLGVMALRLPAGGFAKSMTIGALIFGGLNTFTLNLTEGIEPPIITLIAAAYTILETRFGKRPGKAVGVAALAIFGVRMVYRFYLEAPTLGPNGVFIVLCVELIALLTLLRLADSRPGLMTGGAAFLIFTAALATTDRRTVREQFLEDSSLNRSLEQFLKNSGNTYWENGIEFMWFKLKRPNYYNCIQGAGVVYNYKNAIDYQRRSDALSKLNTSDFADDPNDMCALKAVRGKTGAPTLDQLKGACKALPDLDTLVLDNPVTGAVGQTWQPPTLQHRGADRFYLGHGSMFYRYSCSTFR